MLLCELLLCFLYLLQFICDFSFFGFFFLTWSLLLFLFFKFNIFWMRVVYKFQHFSIYINIRNTSFIHNISKTIIRATSEPSDIFSTNISLFAENPDSTRTLPCDNVSTSLTTSLDSTWRDISDSYRTHPAFHPY